MCSMHNTLKTTTQLPYRLRYHLGGDEPEEQEYRIFHSASVGGMIRCTSRHNVIVNARVHRNSNRLQPIITISICNLGYILPQYSSIVPRDLTTLRSLLSIWCHFTQQSSRILVLCGISQLRLMLMKHPWHGSHTWNDVAWLTLLTSRAKATFLTEAKKWWRYCITAHLNIPLARFSRLLN